MTASNRNRESSQPGRTFVSWPSSYTIAAVRERRGIVWQRAVSCQHPGCIARATIGRPSDAGARPRGTPSAWAAAAAAAGLATAAAARITWSSAMALEKTCAYHLKEVFGWGRAGYEQDCQNYSIFYTLHDTD